MSKSLKRVQRALVELGLEIEVLEMPGETRTAQQAADAAGCDVDQIAKSVIFATDDGIVLFLTAGGNSVDPGRASEVAGQALAKADAQQVRQVTGFAIGGVAPIGHLTPSRAFMDPRLMEFSEIWAAAGTPRHIFPISPAELQRASAAQLADFTT